MSNGKEDLERIVLTEAQVREVIERATRSESRPAGISLAELREIAAELAIDPQALDLALQQVLSHSSEPSSSWHRLKTQVDQVGRFLDDVLPRRARVACGAILGAAFGWVSGGFSPGSEMDVPVGAAMVALTLANSLSRRIDQRFKAFLSETVSMWSAFAVVWSAEYGTVTGDLVTWISINIVGAAVWAWFIVRNSGPGLALPAAESPVLENAPVRPPVQDELRRERANWIGLFWPTLIRPSRS